MSWRDSALCAQVDPAIFFPEKGASTREARSVCRVCPVRRECLEAALSSPWEEHGVWGDTSVLERRAMRPKTVHAGGCTVKGCDQPHTAKGYCSSHYNRIVRTAS